MGNVCCKFDDEFKPKNSSGKGFERISNSSLLKPQDETHDEHIPLEASQIPCLKLLGEEQIDQFFKEAQIEIQDSSICQTKFRLINEKLKMFGNEYTMHADFPELESGNKLHHYRNSVDYPFTPAMYFLHSLQLNIESYSRVDDSLDQLELLNYSSTDDTIVIISRSRTKKILVIEPRSFIVVRIIKKISDYEFMEVQKSINLTNLAKVEPFSHIASLQPNLGEMKISVYHLFQKDSKFFKQSMTKVDILSSTGPMILKVALKGKFSKIEKNMTKETLRFILTKNKSDYKNLKWFTSSEEEIDKIFEENLKIVKAWRPNLTDLDKVDQEMLSDKLSQISASNDVVSEPIKLEDSLKVVPAKVNEVKSETKINFPDITQQNLTQSEVVKESIHKLSESIGVDTKINEDVKPVSAKNSNAEQVMIQSARNTNIEIPEVENKVSSHKNSEAKVEEKVASHKNSEAKVEEKADNQEVQPKSDLNETDASTKIEESQIIDNETTETDKNSNIMQQSENNEEPQTGDQEEGNTEEYGKKKKNKKNKNK